MNQRLTGECNFTGFIRGWSWASWQAGPDEIALKVLIFVREGRLPLNYIWSPEWACNTPTLFFNLWVQGGAVPQKDLIPTAVQTQPFCPAKGWSPPRGTSRCQGESRLFGSAQRWLQIRAGFSMGLKHMLQTMRLGRFWMKHFCLQLFFRVRSLVCCKEGGETMH